MAESPSFTSELTYARPVDSERRARLGIPESTQRRGEPAPPQARLRWDHGEGRVRFGRVKAYTANMRGPSGYIVDTKDGEQTWPLVGPTEVDMNDPAQVMEWLRG